MVPLLKAYERSRRHFLKTIAVAGLGLGTKSTSSESFTGHWNVQEIRIGIIGLSVHSADFTKILNSEKLSNDMYRCRVVAIYHPAGNPDVEFSAQRLDEFRNIILGHGVKIVYSIEEVLENADAVMVLTNDGRPHLQEVLPVLKARKPVFIDKPLAADLTGILAIFNASTQYGVPVFSSSALRYVKKAQDIRQGKLIGKVLGAEAYGPAPIQESHVDLFWDGIHGVETLYTVMGIGCQSVTCSCVNDTDVATGTWRDGRIGVFRGLRTGKIGFGGTAYGTDAISDIGPFEGYQPLIVAISDFFRKKTPPVSEEETLEIYTFMAAADESKRRGGIPVRLSDVLSAAKKKMKNV